MGAKVKIEHVSEGWLEIFLSDKMQEVVDAAGEKIAAEAGEHFGYAAATHNKYTVGGFVSGDASGDFAESTDKVLTKAVHG